MDTIDLRRFRICPFVFNHFVVVIQCKLRTALEWVVFTSSRTTRLELTKALDAGKNWK